MSGAFELGEVHRIAPLEPASLVRHEVLIVAPGVSPVEHTGLVVIGHATDVTLTVMVDDDVVVDIVSGGNMGAKLTCTSPGILTADSVE